MPRLVLYRYRVYDAIHRRWYIPHAMTEEGAPSLDSATRLDWSREERNISEDWRAMSTSTFLFRSR